MVTRRQFIVGSLAFGGLASSAFGKVMSNKTMPISEGYGSLLADPQGLLDLPQGFSYKIISSLGNAMADGMHVPDRADGMGCLVHSSANNTVALIRNHELVALLGFATPAAAEPVEAITGLSNVAACWNIDMTSPAGQIVVIVDFQLDIDGRVVDQHVALTAHSEGQDADVEHAYQAARRAVLRCQPPSGFDLPRDAYESWQHVSLTFDPSGIRIR